MKSLTCPSCWTRLRAGGDIDVIRRSVEMVLQALIDAEATEVIGARPHERTDTRTNQRNGTRPRLLSTKAGDVELAIPKVHKGSFFPSVLERRRRIDRALFAVVMEAYVHGVSTRNVDDLVKSLGLDAGISKSEVSRICSLLDDDLEAFRTRPLGHVEFPYVFVDATFVRGRLRGRVVSRAIVGPPGSPPLVIAKSWVLTSAIPRTAPSGRRSCAPCAPAASPACN